MHYPATPHDYLLAEARFQADLADLIERSEPYLGTPRDADHWDTEDLAKLRSVPVTGWVLIVERHDPVLQPGGTFTAYEAPAHQSPAHSTGLLAMALDRSK